MARRSEAVGRAALARLAPCRACRTAGQQHARGTDTDLNSTLTLADARRHRAARPRAGAAPRRPATSLGLTGGLGAGKSTFARALIGAPARGARPRRGDPLAELHAGADLRPRRGRALARRPLPARRRRRDRRARPRGGLRHRDLPRRMGRPARAGAAGPAADARPRLRPAGDEQRRAGAARRARRRAGTGCPRRWRPRRPHDPRGRDRRVPRPRGLGRARARAAGRRRLGAALRAAARAAAGAARC